jgi:Skp family chaperone for outer membrane proteins
MRWFLLTAILFALIGVAATVAVTGFGGLTRRAEAALPLPEAAPAIPKSKIAVFNMAKVMKDYNKAKYQVNLLNEERKKLMAELVAMQAQYLKNQRELFYEDEFKPDETKGRKQVALINQIEDKDRKINKQMNEKEEAIFSSFYDEIKTVVDKLAELNGYDIVLAYPDAISPEELKNSKIKELKLKPLAAQPFFVARHVDVTDVVIKTLNVWYPPPSILEGTQLPMPTPMK